MYLKATNKEEYLAPDLQVLEIVKQGVLCASGSDAGGGTYADGEFI